MSDDDSPTRIAMVLYPGLTTLDVVGPHQVLTSVPNATVDLVAKTGGPIVTDAGMRLIPDKTFQQAGTGYDIIFVPGGPEVHTLVGDTETLAYVAAVGAGARYVTSVCTGSLILAAAGLLRGYRAGCHWAFREFLTAYGAIPDPERIVVDRNRMTGGGVTAGIDFGLSLAAVLAGDRIAETIQLILEYDPQPPFDAGNPAHVDAATLALTNEWLAPSVDPMREAAEHAAAAPH